MSATAMVFHVGEGNGDTLSVAIGTSVATAVGESNVVIDLTDRDIV